MTKAKSEKINEESANYKAGYDKGYTLGYNYGYKAARKLLMAKKVGKWVMTRDGKWYCSRCKTINRQRYDDYCCKCGAMMNSEEALTDDENNESSQPSI